MEQPSGFKSKTNFGALPSGPAGHFLHPAGVARAFAMEYVDYRRYADYVRPVGSDATEGARGGARVGLHRAAAAAEEAKMKAGENGKGAEDTAAGEPSGKRLPIWWLFFLPLYWFPQGINFGLIQTYLLPFQVEAIVGDARKQFFLSLMITSRAATHTHTPHRSLIPGKFLRDSARLR